MIPKSLFFAFALAAGAVAAPADTVIVNARIWTDGRTGFAPFAAIADGRFVHVGAPAERFIGPGTQRIDARGRVVLPGLIDSHVHMLSGGAGLRQLQLRDVSGKDEFIARVGDWARHLAGEHPGRPRGDVWIRGGRWSTESWDEPETPTREWVDAVSDGHPLFLPRMDGHSALVNSEALRRAGITRDTPPDPEGGVIDRDRVTGEPTGILRESAMDLVSSHIPPASVPDRVAALKRAMREANRHGITAVADIPGIDDLDVYEAIADEDVTARLFVYPTAMDWEAAATAIAAFRARPYLVQVNGLKTYLDGSLGSRTAYMRAPFLGNEPGRESWRGLLAEGVDGGRLRDRVEWARRSGLQTIAHAIGDEANHLLLDTLEAVYPDLRAARCRSEHAQHLLPADIARFGALGVIASMQPYHKADDGRYAEACIGAERSRSSYAFRSLLDAGGVVVFGSDWPVVSINPFLGIEAAVTGRTLDGKAWQTQENITVGEALRSYTSRAAYGVRAEDEIGRIAPGYRADFIILDGSPFDPPVDWSRVRVDETWVEGRRVHRGASGAAQ